MLRVTDDGRSAALAFELYAQIAGRHTLEVTLRYGGVTRTRLGCDIDVAPGSPDVAPGTAQAESTRRQSGELLSSQPFYGLLLQIQAGQGQAGAPITRSSAMDRGRSTRGPSFCPAIQAMLNQLFCGSRLPSRGSAYQRETNCATSAVAWRRAPPSEIVDALFEPRWDPATALHIECGNLNLPWELLRRVQQRASVPGLALCDHALSRAWGHRAMSSGGLLRAGRAGGLWTWIAADREALALLTPPPIIEMNDAESLLRFLRGNTPCGVLHFACHGDASPGQMFGNKLALERASC